MVYLGGSQVVVSFNRDVITIEDAAQIVISSPFVRHANCYLHIITVSYRDKTTYFEFFGSVHDFVRGKRELQNFELLEAFKIILEDAMSYTNYTFEEFLNYIWGHDQPLKALNSYLACRETYLKLKELVLGNTDLEQLVDIISEILEGKYE